ncbi:homoserine dehydrogenase [Polymorphobacter multimanifer]|nr:homoserine dehydrogenase [Polymorphobacter multimanifer]
MRIGLAGLGTVGAGVIRLLAANQALIARRAGRPIIVTAISARDRSRDRGIDMAGLTWLDDATELAAHPDVDVVVELIGGSDGPALPLARRTLGAAKPFVTANKALIAHHGRELAALAEANGAPLAFEAAVAGGIPVLKALGEGAAANRIVSVYGLLNGTCNYILSRMESDGLDFGTVLADAQAAGFAEADPSFDIDGIDTAHKLAILAGLAFGAAPDFAGVATVGIRAIDKADIEQAAALGFRIKLVGLAETADGELFQRVHPALVAQDHPLAATNGALNAVVIEAVPVGRLFLQGRGAGEGPTASAVVADLIDIAQRRTGLPFGMPVAELASLPRADSATREGRYYLRLSVADRPGVLAELTAALRDHGVSIESLIQRPHADSSAATVVMVTHTTTEAALQASLEAMAASPSVSGRPVMMHILDL